MEGKELDKRLGLERQASKLSNGSRELDRSMDRYDG